jgi:hypothetical protein
MGALAQVDILQKAQDPDAVELRGSVADLLEEISVMFGDPESGSANLESARLIAVKANMILSRLRGKSADEGDVEEDPSDMPPQEVGKRRSKKSGLEDDDQEEAADEDSDLPDSVQATIRRRLQGEVSEDDVMKAVFKMVGKRVKP